MIASQAIKANITLDCILCHKLELVGSREQLYLIALDVLSTVASSVRVFADSAAAIACHWVQSVNFEFSTFVQH